MCLCVCACAHAWSVLAAGRSKYFASQVLATKYNDWDFPGGTVVKNLPANAGDTGSIPGPGRSRMAQSS